METVSFKETKHFEIRKETEMYNNVLQLFRKIRDVKTTAKLLAEELGGTDFCNRSHKLAGGISAIEFPTGKPSAEWKQVGEKSDNLFYPKAKAKKIEIRILSLPTVEYDELCSLIMFKRPQSFVTEAGGLAWCDCPHIFITENFDIYLRIFKNMRYEVPSEMTEITQLQFDSTNGLDYSKLI